MKKDTETKKLLKKLDPYGKVIGISESMTIHGGFDQSFEQVGNTSPEWATDPEQLAEWKQDQLTCGQRRLLANEMIRRWTEYRDAIKD